MSVQRDGSEQPGKERPSLATYVLGVVILIIGALLVIGVLQIVLDGGGTGCKADPEACADNVP